jgi:hypothetical protein
MKTWLNVITINLLCVLITKKTKLKCAIFHEQNMNFRITIFEALTFLSSLVLFHFHYMPVGKRYICKDREVLKQQFDTNTDLPYNKFMEKKRNQTFKRILFYTNECSHNSTRDIVPWMQNSVFCLHPTGATRIASFSSVVFPSGIEYCIYCVNLLRLSWRLSTFDMGILLSMS